MREQNERNTGLLGWIFSWIMPILIFLRMAPRPAIQPEPTAPLLSAEPPLLSSSSTHPKAPEEKEERHHRRKRHHHHHHHHRHRKADTKPRSEAVGAPRTSDLLSPADMSGLSPLDGYYERKGIVTAAGTRAHSRRRAERPADTHEPTSSRVGI